MPDKDAGTPRVFLIRHGETTWSMLGRYTGKTDLPLTLNGEKQVTASGKAIVGPGKVIDPSQISHLFVSPRFRALRTHQLLFGIPEYAYLQEKLEVSEDIREWEYGAYEGLLTAQIRALRKDRGLDTEKSWNIWVDGCEEGESPAEVTNRLDRIIARIRQMQGPYMHGEKPVDIVLIAHGHILRAFAKRWIGFELSMRLPMMLEPGAIGILSYEHHRVDEPAIMLGVNMGSSSE